MKRTYFLPLVLLALAFPVAALAAVGGGGVAPPQPVSGAQLSSASLAPLREPVKEFRRAIDVAGERIAARRRAAARRERHLRRQRFAQLPGGVSLSTLDAIAACESGGDPRAVSADGTYRGKYQFDRGTWESVGGHGDPAAASAAEQDYRAALLYERSGPSPWPVCG